MNLSDPVTRLGPSADPSAPGRASAGPAAGLGVGTVVGGYRVLRAAGGGGMGEVYEADDDRLGRTVALKVMRAELATSPATRERFVREARALAAVSNDHVVTIHQVGEHDGRPFLVMELLRGETLDAALRRGPLPLLQLLKVGREVANGLAAAHLAGVVHRDVKPENVILEARTDRAKLIDFGLAYTPAFSDSSADARTAAGTPLYMSPEQVAGRPVDARTDLFSLGVLLYRMAGGRVPFAGATLNEWKEKLLAPDPPEPVERLNAAVPPPLADLVRRLLAKDPADRPPSAAAVEWELMSMLQVAATQSGILNLGPLPPQPSGVQPVIPPAPRRKWWWWAGFVGLIAFLAIAAVFLLELLTLQVVITEDPPVPPPPPWVESAAIPLFDGRTLNGWHGLDGKTDQWAVRDGVLVGTPQPGGDQFLLSDQQFADHRLAFEFRWPGQSCHSSVFVWADTDRRGTDGGVSGLEVNLSGDSPEEAPGPLYAAGGVYLLGGPKRRVRAAPPGEWNKVTVTAVRSRLTVEWNGVVSFDEPFDRFTDLAEDLPALARRNGAVALRTHGRQPIQFRNITATPLTR